MRPLIIATFCMIVISTGCMQPDQNNADDQRTFAGNLDLESIESTDFYRSSFESSGGYLDTSTGGNTFLDSDKVENESLKTFMINYRDEENAGKLTEGPPNVIISGYTDISEPIELEKQVEKHAQGLKNSSLTEVDSVNREGEKFIIKSREVSGNETVRYSYQAIKQEDNSVYTVTVVDFEGYKKTAAMELLEALTTN